MGLAAPKSAAKPRVIGTSVHKSFRIDRARPSHAGLEALGFRISKALHVVVPGQVRLLTSDSAAADSVTLSLRVEVNVPVRAFVKVIGAVVITQAC